MITGQKTKRQSPMIPAYETRSGKLAGHFTRPDAQFWHKRGRRVECTLCFRRCVLDKYEKGWCQIRQNENGRLILLQPYTHSVATVWNHPLPTYLMDKPMAYFGGVNCTFGCVFCSSTRIAWKPELLDWVGGQENTLHSDGNATYYRGLLHPEGAIAFAEVKGVDHIQFGANEPLLDFEWVYAVARLAKDAGLTVSMDTNGSANPDAIRKIAPYIDMAHVGIKGTLDEEFYKTRVRAEGAVPHVKEGIKTWRQMQDETGTVLQLSDTIAPYHWMDDDTFERRAHETYQWIADTVGTFTVLQIRQMVQPQWPPSYDEGNQPLIAPKADGDAGQERVLDRAETAREIASLHGIMYAVAGMAAIDCHNCGLLLRGDAAPDHICQGCGEWTPVRTWEGQDL